MIRALLLAIAYVGLVGAMVAALAIHHDVTMTLAAIVMTCAFVVALVIFVDETRQQRRKWRDRPERRHPVIKDWNQ